MYEIHITTRTSQAFLCEEVARQEHWKTSEIARDPVLGNDTYFYLTTHADTFQKAFFRMSDCVFALEEVGVEIVREKIEHIVHDIRHRPK